ncbi:MAG: 3-hydroxy-9,10-secoandrosta-1,3,5(10)-triene-9,17-dione monooxygenase [Gammaproteobacteria bacterium]|jgi:3-hydroxy-9,10-secoandrosta-1,3,5(10)-triene-9,17-dione monooxygenase
MIIDEFGEHMNTIAANSTGDDMTTQHPAEIENLVQEFAARKTAAIEARRIPDANIKAMRDAGLYRVYNPKRFGGDAVHMDDVLPTVARIAEACPASAWVLAVFQIHNWVLSLFPEQAQHEVFGANQDAVACASLNPSKNMTRKVAGGYLIEDGRFTFCSGAHHRDWALLGSLIVDDAGAVCDVGCMLVPGDDLEELDDWYVSGLQATGSISLLAKELFVPEHRFLSYGAATAYQSPGRTINSESLYMAAFVPMLVLNLAGPALGAAETALRAFVANLNEKGSKAGTYPLPGIARVDAPATHEAIATARMQIDCARLLLQQSAATIRRFAELGQAMRPEDSAKVNLETSYAVRECLKATQLLFLQAGGAVLHPGHPLQEAYQDVTAVNCHGFLGHEANLSLYGSLVTGHDHPEAFL